MTVKNLEASVHARLQNHARATKRPFQELLQYYAMERFLYRLSKTPHRARLVLKGALMLIPSSAVESMGMGGLMGSAALAQQQLTSRGETPAA